MTKRPNFHVSREDSALILAIVERYAPIYRESVGEPLDRLSATMDLSACHNSCPLKLATLLAADEFNFIHDVAGIQRHMDRETGELGDCFLPRYAHPDRASVPA